jgi:hypothetical protein
MLSKMLSPFRTRTREESFIYIPYALLALWFTAFLFHAISYAPVFSSLSLLTSTNQEQNPNPNLNSNGTQEYQYQYRPRPQLQPISIFNVTTLLFLGLFTSLTFLLSFTHLLLHLQSLHPNRNFGAIAFYLFALAGLICFGMIVIDSGNVGFSVYVESIVWPGLGLMTGFVVGVFFVELCKYMDEKERKKEMVGGEPDVEAEAGTGDEDEDGSEVVVEEKLERRLESMEVDLERGIGGTEGDDEEEGEVVGEDEPMIRKGKEKEADAENENGVETGESAEDCDDADFVEVPRK